jgi:hypothetical protein
MKTINFTNWQELGLKKDIEGIYKKINQLPMFNNVVLTEIVIGILTLALGAISVINNDGGFISKRILISVFAILGGVSIVIPLLVFFIGILKKRKDRIDDIINGTMPVEHLVDIFDNKICNYVMMANTLCENILVEDKVETQYFISETSYYLNKSIDNLKKMECVAGKIFKKSEKDGKKDGKKVTSHRLLLVLKLIIETRKEIQSKIDEVREKDPHSENIYLCILHENDDYKEKLKKFIDCAHIDVDEKMGFDLLIADLDRSV